MPSVPPHNPFGWNVACRPRATPDSCLAGGLSAQDVTAYGADDDEKNEGGKEAGRGKETERHGNERRRSDERTIFGERHEQAIGSLVFAIVHLRAEFDGTGRRMVGHGIPLQIKALERDSENPQEGQWRYCRITRTQPGKSENRPDRRLATTGAKYPRFRRHGSNISLSAKW